MSWAALVLPQGWGGERARGVFSNANAAAIIAFLLIGVSLWMGAKHYRIIIPLALLFVILTGSRAGLLAALIVITVALFAHLSTRGRITVVGISAIAAYPALIWGSQSIPSSSYSPEILRTANTRADAWDIAFDFIRSRPWLGAGYRATPEGLGSTSYLKMLAEFGIIGSILAVALIVGYILWSRADYIMMAITLGALVNAIFEDWLLTAGAPMLAVYLLLLMSTPQGMKRSVQKLSPRTDANRTKSHLKPWGNSAERKAMSAV